MFYLFGKVGESEYIQKEADEDFIIPNGYLMLSEDRPSVNYIIKDNGDGTGTWIIDKDYYKRINKPKVQALKLEAVNEITILKYEDDDAQKLAEWEAYYVALKAVDTSFENMELPEKPE